MFNVLISIVIIIMFVDLLKLRKILLFQTLILQFVLTTCRSKYIIVVLFVDDATSLSRNIFKDLCFVFPHHYYMCI